MEQTRCAACGKPIVAGEKTYRVAVGRSRGTDFNESSEWGRMHESCFGQAVDSPKLILAEVLKLTRERTVPVRKSRKRALAKAV